MYTFQPFTHSISSAVRFIITDRNMNCLISLEKKRFVFGPVQRICVQAAVCLNNRKHYIILAKKELSVFYPAVQSVQQDIYGFR